ncbi:MAG: spore cortex biosynthesis protein YabQ [Firmicutes bacterium]|nr:spore cortex biosynthesis protein YabQ [Bacillota bacterium]
MLYTTLGQGYVFLALLALGAGASLACRPLLLYVKLKFPSGPDKKHTDTRAVIASLASGANKRSNLQYSTHLFKKGLVFTVDLLVCLFFAGVFWFGLLLFHFGEFRLFCLLGFLTGILLEKLLLAKTVDFLLLKAYTLLAKIVLRLRSKLCRKPKPKQDLNSAKQ